MGTLTQQNTELNVLSEADRVRQQTNEEWLTEYGDAGSINKPASSQIVDLQPKIETNNQNSFLKSLKDAGIVSIKYVGADLLITTDRPITKELNNRINRALPRLTEIAEPDTGESLYIYSGYRTLYSKGRQHLALEFKEIHSGENADRYFNIILQNKQGKKFKTGANGEFRIKGSINRPMKGSFIKFWFDMMNEIPYSKPSHIYRHMNSKLSAVVISCLDIEPHHDDTKFHNYRYEGRLYKTT